MFCSLAVLEQSKEITILCGNIPSKKWLLLGWNVQITLKSCYPQDLIFSLATYAS